jgi:hypothetical protein
MEESAKAKAKARGEMRKVASSHVITCNTLGKKLEATIIIYDDGTLKVQCLSKCPSCKYKYLYEVD